MSEPGASVPPEASATDGASHTSTVIHITRIIASYSRFARRDAAQEGGKRYAPAAHWLIGCAVYDLFAKVRPDNRDRSQQ
jgi:hypothetical protein